MHSASMIGQLRRIWRKELHIIREHFFTLAPSLKVERAMRNRALVAWRTREHISDGHFVIQALAGSQMLTQRKKTITPTPRSRARLNTNGR